MKTGFKYGVSAVALLAAVSLAQAQTNEHQGGGASGSEHSMGKGGGEPGGSVQSQRGAGGSAQAEHGQNGASSQHQRKGGRGEAVKPGRRERACPLSDRA